MERIEKILIDERTIAKRVKELADRINEDYKDSKSELVFVGILKGAVYFFADLTRAVKIPAKLELMAASSYEGSETSGEVRLLHDITEPVGGKDIIIVEDIVDTGVTLKYLAGLFKSRGAKSVRLCALLDKPSRRKVDIKADYTGFEIGDDFVVGYGLDYNQRWRNLPYIAVIDIT